LISDKKETISDRHRLTINPLTAKWLDI